MSYDQLKQMPKKTVFGKIVEISNPAVKRNDSINAVSIAVARAITTMDHSKFDATVDVALVAKDSTVSYIKARDGFIITSIPNVKDSVRMPCMRLPTPRGGGAPHHRASGLGAVTQFVTV